MKEAESASRLEGSLRAGRGSRRRPRNGHRNGSALEQFLKENASGLTFLGVTLGVFVSRKFGSKGSVFSVRRTHCAPG